MQSHRNKGARQHLIGRVEPQSPRRAALAVRGDGRRRRRGRRRQG